MVEDEILLQVAKPARYTGNEINMVVKKPDNVDIRFGFCFPDVYEVGMSHLGLQILYYFLNQREDTYCERVFMPWVDMYHLMKEKGYPLFALESMGAVNTFDFLGFTLQYEMSYTNIIAALDLAKIPYYSRDRASGYPIICAGGPCAYNPEPLADIVDFFYIGEGEAALNKVLDIYKACATKNEFLEKILCVEGIYVPKFYKADYENKEFLPLHENAALPVNKVIVDDLGKVFFPEKQLVPIIETVHDRATLEVFRGCIRGCRFCQAGYVYRPVREKDAVCLLGQADSLLKNSGHEEISLVSLSTGDYTGFKGLSEGLLKYKGQQVNISLPSLRIDAFTLDLMEKVQGVRKSGITFAPEAGTQRLRDVINKNITEDEILDGCRLLFSGGYNRVKLYFMIGLPTEEDEDIIGIAGLANKIADVFYEQPKNQRTGGVTITVSTSCFVPKPFTPFQWYPQDSMEEFVRKQKLLKDNIKRKCIKYNYHDSKVSFLEAVFAKGDRRLAPVIIKAYENGAMFDGWSEHFNFKAWMGAFEECNISPGFYANRELAYDELLPWGHISVGVDKEFFISEYEKAKATQTTPNCREACSLCGAHKFNAGVCKGPGSQACAQGNPETAETKLALPGAAAKGVPPVSGQYNYRLKFSKLGRMVFIGHLDLLKLFQKIFRKAGLPVRYSNGFNPHQIMSFACPLPLGFSSCAEYLDIGLTQEIEPETIKQLINMALPNGLSILDVKRAYKNASAQVAAAAYEVKFKHNVSPEIIEGILREKEIFIDKKTKSGTKREDIRGGIYDLRLIGSCTVYMLISTGSKQNLKPELLAGLICQGFDYNKFDIRYLRAEIYTLINNGLVSLNAWGEEF